ncbi:Ref family recombination enhancement nuclease [Kluyvera georgiana]|uniref:Ref family recombination enhancement nuclease n=1 Tax=Kluyvera georgiana TaxID=73098 RepID=UPI003AF16060
MAKHQTKAEKVHVNKVASLGCVACYVQAGVWGTPGEIHHIREGQGMAQRAGWNQVICLCTNHHRNSGNGKIAIHSGKRSFTDMYGSELFLLNLTLDNI